MLIHKNYLKLTIMILSCAVITFKLLPRQSTSWLNKLLAHRTNNSGQVANKTILLLPSFVCDAAGFALVH
jgi:hypothetical protein